MAALASGGLSAIAGLLVGIACAAEKSSLLICNNDYNYDVCPPQTFCCIASGSLIGKIWYDELPPWISVPFMWRVWENKPLHAACGPCVRVVMGLQSTCSAVLVQLPFNWHFISHTNCQRSDLAPSAMLQSVCNERTSRAGSLVSETVYANRWFTHVIRFRCSRIQLRWQGPSLRCDTARWGPTVCEYVIKSCPSLVLWFCCFRFPVQNYYPLVQTGLEE